MNRNTFILAALAVAALACGVVYLTGDPADRAPVTAAPEKTGAGPTAVPESGNGTSPTETTTASGNANAKPLPPDPRLAAMQVSPDNGLIKFVKGADGKVIAEIDQDPASPGYGKPSREYMYAGDKVVGLTAYRYLRDQVEITQTRVSYKPDGSVDAFDESTSYQGGAQKTR